MTIEELKAHLDADGFKFQNNGDMGNFCRWLAYRPTTAKECEANEGKQTLLVILPHHVKHPAGIEYASVEIEIRGEAGGEWFSLKAFGLDAAEAAEKLDKIEASLIAAWNALLIAGHGLILELKPASRSAKQNRLLHALLGDISKQVEWAGKKRDVDCWKRLMTAAWLRARGESVEILPAIDGHGVDVVFRRTSKLTRAECSELMEFVMAWAVEHGVQLSDEAVDPETGEITTRDPACT